MNQYQDSNIISNPALKDRARGALAGRFSQAVPAFFLVCVISFGASLILRFFFSFMYTAISLSIKLSTGSITFDTMFEMLTESASPSDFQFAYNISDFVIQMIISVFTGIFNVGLSLVWLNLACGRQTQISDIFYGFKSQFGKSMKLSAAHTLAQWIFLFPSNVFMYLMNMEISEKLRFTFACLTVGGLVIACYLLLHISQCFFLMLDFPGYSASQLLRLSCKIMTGHKKRLFFLLAGFLPLLILSAFTLGIAGLWILPYMEVTKAFFFLNLMQARTSDY